MERRVVVYNPVEHRLSESIVSATIGSKGTQGILAKFELDASRYDVRGMARNYNLVDCHLTRADIAVMTAFPSIVIQELRHFHKRKQYRA